MFFGLEVKSNQNQSKPITLTNTLKLSHAALDPGKNNKKEPVCLMVEYDKKQFILCVLEPNVTWQSPLDLVFEGGSQVKFFIRGTGAVHLTGYEDYDDLDDMSMSMSSDEEIASDSDEDNVAAIEPVKKKVAVKAASTNKSPKAEKTNGLKAVPKKLEHTNGNGEDEDEDDSDDDDFDFGDLDEDEDEESDEEEDGQDFDEDDDEDDEDDDDDEDMDDVENELDSSEIDD